MEHRAFCKQCLCLIPVVFYALVKMRLVLSCFLTWIQSPSAPVRFRRICSMQVEYFHLENWQHSVRAAQCRGWIKVHIIVWRKKVVFINCVHFWNQCIFIITSGLDAQGIWTFSNLHRVSLNTCCTFYIPFNASPHGVSSSFTTHYSVVAGMTRLFASSNKAFNFLILKPFQRAKRLS